MNPINPNSKTIIPPSALPTVKNQALSAESASQILEKKAASQAQLKDDSAIKFLAKTIFMECRRRDMTPQQMIQVTTEIMSLIINEIENKKR